MNESCLYKEVYLCVLCSFLLVFRFRKKERERKEGSAVYSRKAHHDVSLFVYESLLRSRCCLFIMNRPPHIIEARVRVAFLSLYIYIYQRRTHARLELTYIHSLSLSHSNSLRYEEEEEDTSFVGIAIIIIIISIYIHCCCPSRQHTYIHHIRCC